MKVNAIQKNKVPFIIFLQARGKAAQSPPPPCLTPQKPQPDDLEMTRAARLLHIGASFENVMSYIENTDRINHLAPIKKGYTPVAMANIAVVRYVDESKHHLEIAGSLLEGGSFVLIPNESFEDFIEFKNNVNTCNQLFISHPLIYFLDITTTTPINLTSVSKNVVEVSPEMYQEFTCWYRLIKRDLQ